MRDETNMTNEKLGYLEFYLSVEPNIQLIKFTQAMPPAVTIFSF